MSSQYTSSVYLLYRFVGNFAKKYVFVLQILCVVMLINCIFTFFQKLRTLISFQLSQKKYGIFQSAMLDIFDNSVYA